MQEKSHRRSNQERSEATRNALLQAARALFVEKGYAETGTPEIVAAANVTRGALYHHFADKTDLFRAVVLNEAQAVAAHIAEESTDFPTALDGLLAGAEAFFSATGAPGRAKLLLLDGPSVLGHAAMAQIDQETGGQELREGLAFAMESGTLTDVPLDALAELLSAAFDRAALAIAAGQPADDYKNAIARILQGLLNEA